VAGTLALLLSAIGLYGVISYVVAQRSGEIGIRLALGAPKEWVKFVVVAQALALVGLGLALGLGAAAAGTRVLRSLLFEVSPTEPLVLAAVVAVLLAVAALASYLPARRAAAVDPMAVLRGG
jgi:putative ABC transport system permease protein